MHDSRLPGFLRSCAVLAGGLLLAACGDGGGGAAGSGTPAPPPNPAPPPGDPTAPTVAILSPTQSPDFITATATLGLSGVATDNDGLASVRWSTSAGAGGIANGLDQWQIDSVPLIEGTTVITVVAADVSGNTRADSLTVLLDPAANMVPTIGGTPPVEVLRDETYDFQPVAEDGDGDPLVFTIANQPTWSAFDPATGRLTGTPTMEDIGNHEGIEITVSDGQDSASLAGFSIDVLESGLFSVSLSWIAPTERVDGSPLTNLGGYHIYYGGAQLDQQIVIDNPGITTWTVEELSAGSYQIAMTAYDQNGLEGERSQIVEVTLGETG